MKIDINANLDYIAGYLRYGHLEGTIDIPEEDIEKFKENPKKYIEDNDYEVELELVVDDWIVNDRGEIDNVVYNIIIPTYPCRECGMNPTYCCGCEKEREWNKKYKKYERGE